MTFNLGYEFFFIVSIKGVAIINGSIAYIQDHGRLLFEGFVSLLCICLRSRLFP